MQALYAYLAKHPVVYVTRERERGEGLADNTEGYSIISDMNKSTRELINEIENVESAAILVFKANRQVEDVCRAKNWRLLNPKAELAEQVEGKVSQVRWLGELAGLLPEHWEGELIHCPWALPFILQWNWGHSGEGTHMIKTSEQLGELIKKFPYRKVRVSKFIEGDTFTNNNVVTKDERVLVGNISLQITGDSSLTDNQFATVGNDWTQARETLSEKNLRDYHTIVQKVGEKLVQDGWKGLFGLDVLLEKDSDKMYLIEINARQPASSSYESRLQRESGKTGVTTFEAHLAALLNLDLSGEELIKIDHGRRTINRKESV